VYQESQLKGSVSGSENQEKAFNEAIKKSLEQEKQDRK
jgi:hypothetical protein